MVAIRRIRETDASAFLALCKTLDKETQFMLLEPGERRRTTEEQRARIEDILAKDNQTILVAENNGKLVGYIIGLGGLYRRNRRTVYVVMGLLQAFGGQGLGTKLLADLEKWARKNKTHRLELTVMAHNKRAIGLYKKMGFEMEGMKRHSLAVDATYVDEFYMGKLLSRPRPNIGYCGRAQARNTTVHRASAART